MHRLQRAGRRISEAFDRLPIRARLAGVSALLTFIILFSIALVVGSLTLDRIRSDFYNQVTATAAELPSQLSITIDRRTETMRIQPSLEKLAPPGGSTAIKVFTVDGTLQAQAPGEAPWLGAPTGGQPRNYNGYRVISRLANVRYGPGSEEATGHIAGEVIVQYARKLSDVNSTVARVELLLALGVLAGAGLALLAGIVIARRAMAPIAELTSTAAEIARTRDPSLSLPQPRAQDEVGELARTLQGMLRELDSAHAETEAMLARQRRFVADATHELRTPLTSVLANLDLLAESLSGEEAEAARSALRSSQRMRRLVADLLLLARTDVGRQVKREPVDLAAVAIEAAAELGPVSDTHELTLDVKPVSVMAARDEIHRLAINLIENALRHTPRGTEVRVRVGPQAGARDRARLVVEDDGPGVPEHLRDTLFERFVRGAGDRGGSFGLGLAIVKAVAESHGGTVAVEPTHPAAAGDGGAAAYGARFVVSLPVASDLHDDGQHHRSPPQAVVDQLR